MIESIIASVLCAGITISVVRLFAACIERRKPTDRGDRTPI